MLQISQATFDGLVLAFSLMLTVQCLLVLYVIRSARTAADERTKLHKELFGLLKKIEGLTFNRRDHLLRHYDQMVESLSQRLPSTIASQAGQVIFETERMILTRLAELEPNLKSNNEGRQKMDQLIHCMESLEDTVISLTSETARRVMNESRKEIFADEGNENLAA